MKKKVIKTVALCAIIALGACLGACTNYSRYNVVEATYSPSPYAGGVEVGVATGWLTFLGFEVAEATMDGMATKWERWYTRSHEYQTRVVVDTNAKSIAGQCLSRRLKGPWKFTPCRNEATLEYLGVAVLHLEKELSNE
jgi:hypothetical protein